MVWFAHFKNTLDSGDPEIRSWALVDGYYTPFLMCAAYVLTTTKIVPAFMRNRKPMELRNVMILYNFFLVSVYFSSLATIIWYFFTTDCYYTICNEVEIVRGHYTYTVVSATWTVYIIKYLEFADTLFFVLRKKDHLVSNLHVCHHTVVPIIGWLLLRCEKTGFFVPPVCLNSMVHLIMYTYYGLSAMGPSVQKYLWWKKHLTMIQIAQFVIALVYFVIMGTLIQCKTTPYSLSMVSFFTGFFLILFYNFYNKTYVVKSKSIAPEGVTNLLDSSCYHKHRNGSYSDSKD